MFKHWPNKRVRELIGKEQECEILRQEICQLSNVNQQLHSALEPTWQREREIFEALEKYKFVSPYVPVTSKKADVPDNCIWQLWWQGEEQMPDIVRICMDSIKRQNPNRPIVLLTKNNIKDYIELPESIIKCYSSGKITTTLLSDVIRLYLLAQYGGTWIDATVFMSGSMPAVIQDAPFFVYKNLSWLQNQKTLHSPEYLTELVDCQSNRYHCLSSWFIHALPGNRYICKVMAMLLKYLGKR